MAHGWGGTARGLRRDAVVFASAGYLAVTFDYREARERAQQMALEWFDAHL